MDPADEAESAGIGIHSHDRLYDNPRSADGGGGNDGWACHLLRRGWDLTRKAAIAGAAATAAPVVAPPLIVLSAAGVALSVPFAAYLASLAATNHLMDALLRSCYPPSQPYYYQEDDLEQEFLDASEEYGREAPAFGHLGTETEQGEEDEGDNPLLLPRHPGVSEASFAAEAEEEVGGEFSSVQESGLESYTSNRGHETEEHTPVEGSESTGKEVLPMGFGVSELANPLFSDEDNLVQKKGEGGFSVLDPGQTFEPENWKDDVYPKNREEDIKTMEENKSTNETVLQGFDFPEPRVLASGGDDSVVQEEGEGGFSLQHSGQQSFQSKNWDDNKEEGENTMEKGEGEFPTQNLGQYSLLSNTGDKNEEGMTMGEKKSTEYTPPRDFIVPESLVPVLHGEDDVVQSKEGFKVAVLGVVEEANSNTELVMGEVADVQLDITSIAAPESEVLAPSNLACRESPVDLVTGEVVDVDVGIAAAAAESESKVLHLTSESPADPVTEESVDVQLEIISIAAPESEVLPPSNLVAHESPSNLVTGEVVDVYVGTVSAAEPESEVLHLTSESPADPVIGGSVDVQVDTVGAAAPGSEVLPLSSLAACDSQAVAETAHAGDAIRITVMEEIFRDFGDVGKEEDAITIEENKSKSTNETVSQGFYLPESCVPSSVDDNNVVQEKGEGKISAQNLGQYSLSSNTGDKKEQGIRMEENKSTEDMPPRDFAVSGSSVAVLRAEDNVVESKERFEVAVQEVMEEANSTTNLVMGEVADVQVEIIAIAAPETESEVLPPINVVAHELPSDLAAAAPGSEVLHPSNLATSESPADPVTAEIVGVQVDIVAAVAPGSEVLPLSSHAACESHAVAETAHVGEVIGTTVMEDNVRGFGDVGRGVEYCFVPVASVHDGEDVMSTGSTPYFSTMEEEMIDQPNQSTEVGYAVTNEAFGSRVVAGGKAHYTEEQLREQLDTIRTITGYGAVSSSTLEGELAGLYIFVGVEPAVGSNDASDRLMVLNAKLQFLKSIIGVD